MKNIFLLLMISISCTAYGLAPDPSLIMDHWKRAETCLKENDLEQALVEYSEAIEIADFYPGENQYDMYNDRAYVYSLLGLNQEALQDFSVVLKRAQITDDLWKNHVLRALNGRLKIYATLDRFEEAYNDYESIEKIRYLEKTIFNYIKENKAGIFNASQQKTKNNNLNLTLVEYKEKEIQNERDQAKKELSEANDHLYNMGREALNFQASDAVHHGIQAGTHAWSAWEHYREAERMGRENDREYSSGTWDTEHSSKSDRDY
jgi:hypothetical protein